MRQSKSGSWWLSVALIGAALPWPAFAGTSVFEEDFEGGDLCGWSTFASACVSKASHAADLESGLEGLEVPICVPKSSGAGVGFTYTFCGGQLCPDGLTEGCTLTAHVSNVAIDDTDLGGSADLAIDDDTLALGIAYQFGGSESCDVLVTNGAGTVTTTTTLGPACGTALLETESVQALVEGDATLTVANCPSASLLGAVVDLVKPSVIAQVEAVAADLIEAKLLELSDQRWICP